MGMAVGLKTFYPAVNSCTWVPAPWDVPGQALEPGKMPHGPAGSSPDAHHWGMGGDIRGPMLERAPDALEGETPAPGVAPDGVNKP